MKIFKTQYFLLISLLFLLGACAKPIANFSYSTSDESAPANVKFNNDSKKAETYEWSFGDGNTSSEASPNHKYSSSGNYTVTLKAKKGNKTTTMEKKVIIDAPESCLVELETEFGTMTILLYDATPKHRDNFIKLVEEEFYNDLLFHRVINGFMLQGGDPNSKNAQAGTMLGTGGPGYLIDAEFSDTLVHVKGALAAARTGGPGNPDKKSSGSQFYIVHGRDVSERDLQMTEARQDFRYSKEVKEMYLKEGGTPFLDQDYTVFGRVIKGLEIIDKIAAIATNPQDRPNKDVKMKMKIIK